MSDFATAARAAEQAMRDVFPPTPLMRNDHLSARFGADIWLKREDLSPVRSYKIRGAFTAMRKHLAAHPDRRRFVCASAGNHAQGVAWVCRHFGVTGTIFMPVTTPQQKIGKTRTFGGDAIEIVLTGDTFDQSLAAAQAFCADAGAHFLSPFDDADVIEGQASVAVEMLADLDAPPDMVILPVGGGGLAAGVTAYLAAEMPATEILYVEPAGGASLTAALAAGHPVRLERIDSFVDGAAVAQVGARTFARLAGVAPDHVLTAPENRICGTILEMLNIEGIVLEPAGALSVDVLPVLAARIAGRRVVCVTSGGNFDFERLPEVKERAMRHRGLKKYLLLRLPQRPGALRDFLGMLGPEDDIARFEYLKKSARNFGTVLLGIESSGPEHFAALFDRLHGAGYEFRDITEDDTLAGFLI
ncbi:threonine ammonia-lyase IlvA [Rhodobaculum claviforme]|uniref:L-threonine dehydratase n=1 Tax=Rhodobaculum claviforme TaxID=1549854 RepID=A0A934TNM5_9RHOB|nr:threonine ammonia-lyase IlvA [Rhodobaculum claviforme]MBK5928886.1 threonine dehydratase [Rhodobaculum claviforme]